MIWGPQSVWIRFWTGIKAKISFLDGASNSRLPDGQVKPTNLQEVSLHAVDQAAHLGDMVHFLNPALPLRPLPGPDRHCCNFWSAHCTDLCHLPFSVFSRKLYILNQNKARLNKAMFTLTLEEKLTIIFNYLFGLPWNCFNKNNQKKKKQNNFNPSSQETDTGGSLWIWSYPVLQSESQDRSYMQKSCLEKQTNTNYKTKTKQNKNKFSPSGLDWTDQLSYHPALHPGPWVAPP